MNRRELFKSIAGIPVVAAVARMLPEHERLHAEFIKIEWVHMACGGKNWIAISEDKTFISNDGFTWTERA